MLKATKILLFIETVIYLPFLIFGIYAASVQSYAAWIYIVFGLAAMAISLICFAVTVNNGSKLGMIFWGIVNLAFFAVPSIFMFILSKDRY